MSALESSEEGEDEMSRTFYPSFYKRFFLRVRVMVLIRYNPLRGMLRQQSEIPTVVSVHLIPFYSIKSNK